MGSLWLERIVRGDDGKAWIRGRFPDMSNFPVVCRNEDCYAPLGILHSDPITECLYLEEGVTLADRNNTAVCGSCETPHDLKQYVGESFDGTDLVPSERRIHLEKMPDLLRVGQKVFPSPTGSDRFKSTYSKGERPEQVEGETVGRVKMIGPDVTKKLFDGS